MHVEKTGGNFEEGFFLIIANTKYSLSHSFSKQMIHCAINVYAYILFVVVQAENPNVNDDIFPLISPKRRTFTDCNV